MSEFPLVTLSQQSGDQIPVGISACLLGQQVRFDGGHKRYPYAVEVLARYFSYVPVCPEVAIGLGIPRPTIRLVGDPEHPRAVGVKEPSLDVTERLEDFAARQVPLLAGLSGYILKKDSPSCGMERVRVYAEGQGVPSRSGSGIFARELLRSLPYLPVEEEGRLNDPVLRENFVTRVFVYQRWQALLAEGLTPSRLIAFHSSHKYLVMAHSQAAYQRMGRLLSNLARPDLQDICTEYEKELMTALKRRVTPQRHVNVLQHIMGYLKDKIDGGDRRELAESIESYRRGEVHLIVPITLLRHYFRRNPDPYIDGQVYLRPHPEPLGLLGRI